MPAEPATDLVGLKSSTAEGKAICTPFLKWAGRKTSIIGTIKSLLPQQARRLIEPFVGSGAVFLNTSYPENLLADSNSELVNVFRVLKTYGQTFVDHCRRMFVTENNCKDRYCQLRNEFNTATATPERKAVLFIYLNRHCFNGLCRFNAAGKFNTPFGRYDQPHFPGAEMLTFSRKLETAELRAQDFRLTLAEAAAADVVYCDPPYVPLSQTASFTDYAGGGFGPTDQGDLVACCLAAVGRGATVLISNHETPETRELYRDASQIVPLMVKRTISCKGDGRNKVGELIAVFKPTASNAQV